MQISILLRTTTFRLSAIYGLIFALGLAALLGLVYLRSAVYLTHRVDGILVTEAADLTQTPAPFLIRQIDAALSLNGPSNNVFGLFRPDGTRVAGNLPGLPAALKAGDGPIEIAPARSFAARLIARRLPDGEVLVVGRDINQLREMRSILASALIWSGLVVIAVGLACGVALSVAPLRRLRELEDACGDIARGDLTRRLRVTPRHDELDVLASTVNYMVGEVERLLGEVKGATETIAHDLRTPLTRARAQLHRLQQSSAPSAQELARVTAELDEVLERFRALMRLSELEVRGRQIGFCRTNLATVVDEVADLYQPLAEESGVRLSRSAPARVLVDADPKLLFEAVSNLVDNAIKFSGPDGIVSLRLGDDPTRPRIIVEDNGPGIPVAERGAVLKRFYRAERDRLIPGSGLGLSVTKAIVRMHRFELELLDADPGLLAVIDCGSGVADF